MSDPVPSVPSPTSAQEALLEDIRSCIKEYQFQIDFNRFIGISLTVLGVGFSLGVTVAGIYNQAKVAAVLGATSAAVQSLLVSFPLERRVWFYRMSLADAKRVESVLKYKMKLNPDIDVAELVDQFELVRTRTLTQEPLNSIPESNLVKHPSSAITATDPLDKTPA